MNVNSLVSIITPCYNSSTFISQTIDSVIFQTYSNWELIIIDDCSTDNSDVIIKRYCERDSRIKYYRTEKASGSPTKPRNVGISKANGRFIAFLDSDDIWFPEKLEKQLPLFNNNSVAIVFSHYEKMSENGKCSGRVIKSSCFHSYNTLLYGNEIGCLTAIIDVDKVGKCYFQYIGHEDYAFWLSILKKGFTAQNTQSVLAAYRVRKSSVSSNKIKAIVWVWRIYRKVERIPLFISLFYLCSDLIKSVIKSLR